MIPIPGRSADYQTTNKWTWGVDLRVNYFIVWEESVEKSKHSYMGNDLRVWKVVVHLWIHDDRAHNCI